MFLDSPFDMTLKNETETVNEYGFNLHHLSLIKEDLREDSLILLEFVCGLGDLPQIERIYQDVDFIFIVFIAFVET